MSIEQKITRTITIDISGLDFADPDVLPPAVRGQPYEYQLKYKDNIGPVTSTLENLPAGLTCDENGLITGTPTVFGRGFQIQQIATEHDQ